MIKILICNDDGYEAAGLRQLAKGLADEYEVYVCAPASQKSAFSHSITYFRGEHKAYPVEIEGARKAWALEGTPADCAYFGIYGFFKEEGIDLVISGINQGDNVASDIIYSGTVGAAMEGLISGVPSIAMSLCDFESDDFSVAVKACKKVIPYYMNLAEKKEFVLNVNVPPLKEEEIKGFKVCIQEGIKIYPNDVDIVKKDGYYSISSEQHANPEAPENTFRNGDHTAVRNGYITLTPLSFYLQDTKNFDKIRDLETFSL